MSLKLNLFIFAFVWLFISQTVLSAEKQDSISQAVTTNTVPTIDLRKETWGTGKTHSLDGLWQGFWEKLYSPEQLKTPKENAILFPVPGVWGDKARGDDLKTRVILPTLGYMTYHTKVLVPENRHPLYLYLSDMTSAYKIWINGELGAQNGEVGTSQALEKPDFLPKVIQMPPHQGVLDIVIQLSNYHYREGGIWFSLRLTDQSGLFEMAQRPVIFAILFGTILLVIGFYNLSMYAFRSQELAAVYFGGLCLAVGLRRLLIDERVIYMFNWFDWATLQRVEHLCFYLTLPLFISFFCSLYRQHVPRWSIRLSWLTIVPFVVLCLAFPARIYTEFNVTFQILVVAFVLYACGLYFKIVKEKGVNIKAFGLSLLLMAIAVIHDVLKSNGLIVSTQNIAHFGVLAFVVSQSIALQRHYLKNLNLVEAMSSVLKNRNQKLVEMDEFKDEFLATTSHELRTPLQGISGLAKILKEEDQGSLTEDQQRKVSLIASTSQRLSVLVNDILDFESVKHGKLKLNMTRADLSSIAELVLSTLKPVLGNKNITLSAQVSPEVRYINADEFRLQQILFNIMGNAAKYTEAGFIRLNAYYQENEIIIEISDSGVGIPDGKKQSLFRPFEQVHVEGHINASGTGLGLSISRQLVELHGGVLAIESEVGKGTVVKLTFPEDIIIPSGKVEELTSITIPPTDSLTLTETTLRTSLQEGVLKEDLLQGPLSAQNGALVYVVDDEAVNCELVSSTLKKQGYRVETFEDGLKVLARLTETLPDLILLDFMMPRMTGVEVCKFIRKQYDSYEIPIMMLTARLQVSDIVSALTAGANDYLVKPYHEQEMLARVDTQINVRKYWIANRENQKLKEEILRREKLEDTLTEVNTRLLSVLDISNDLILLVNEQLHIVYANMTANHTFAKEGMGLLGQPVAELLKNEVVAELSRLINESSFETFSINTEGKTAEIIWNVLVKRYKEADDIYLALLISPVLATESAISQINTPIDHLKLELTESRKKIDEIEGALMHAITSPLSAEMDDRDINFLEENEKLDETQSNSQGLSSLIQQKEDVVALLRASLNLWERHTHKDKVGLAEQSRCWRVYVDGTTVKTRTFDKYLNVRTVPDRPRWRSVVRTANFVMTSCELDAEENKALLAQIQAVENFYT